MPDIKAKGSLSLRSLINSGHIGSLIGKGGKVIKSMKEESGANIFITNGESMERVVNVKGSPDNVYKAYTRICKQLEQNQQNQGRPRGGMRDSSSNVQISLNLVVASNQCGSIIGKGGTTIKQIKKETGANIQISTDPLPGCTEKCATVSGTSDSVAQAVKEIVAIMVEYPPKEWNVEYNPDNGVGGGMAGHMGFGGSNPMVGFNPGMMNALAQMGPMAMSGFDQIGGMGGMPFGSGMGGMSFGSGMGGMPFGSGMGGMPFGSRFSGVSDRNDNKMRNFSKKVKFTPY